jgi:hypothetical protein
MKVVLRFVARLFVAVVFVLILAALGDMRPSHPLKVAAALLVAFGYMGLNIAIGSYPQPDDRRLPDHRTEALHRVLPGGRLIPSGRPLSKRRTKALLRAWEDFELGIRRPEPPRELEGHSVMWDEWLDGDNGPRSPRAQKNPRGQARG